MQLWRLASPNICIWQAGDPGEHKGLGSNPKAGRLKTQEESMFQFKSKSRKQLMSSSKAGRQEEWPLTHRRISLFILFRLSTDWVPPH